MTTPPEVREVLRSWVKSAESDFSVVLQLRLMRGEDCPHDQDLLTDYAVIARYPHEPEIGNDEAFRAFELCEGLRTEIRKLLPPEILSQH